MNENKAEENEALVKANKTDCKCDEKSKNLIQAAENGCLHCCAKYIRQVGRFVEDRTALMIAADNGNTEIVRLLIPYEAKAQDGGGWSALMLSAKNGHAAIVELLVDLEAGLSIEDGLTAATMAVVRYQPECFKILIGNEIELKASQISQPMLMAYHGNIKDLLVRRNEWQTKHFNLTVLDFALLGGQRRFVRLLARSETLQELFVQSTISRYTGKKSGAIRFLSQHEPLLREVLPIINLVSIRCRSKLLLRAFDEQHDHAAHILRTVCTPDADAVIWYLQDRDYEKQTAWILAGFKHVGFSLRGKTVKNVAEMLGEQVADYIGSNPLKQQQVMQAEKEAERRLPNAKQAAWRQVEAESAFNRTLLLESRDLTWNASQTFKLIHDSTTNQIGQKQALNRLLLLAFARSMHDIVREMLDE